jgi:hypothetical protein
LAAHARGTGQRDSKFQLVMAIDAVITDACAMWLSTLRELFDIARWLSYDQKCILLDVDSRWLIFDRCHI